VLLASNWNDKRVKDWTQSITVEGRLKGKNLDNTNNWKRIIFEPHASWQPDAGSKAEEKMSQPERLTGSRPNLHSYRSASSVDLFSEERGITLSFMLSAREIAIDSYHQYLYSVCIKLTVYGREFE
jgi:hypothetical protein